MVPARPRLKVEKKRRRSGRLIGEAATHPESEVEFRRWIHGVRVGIQAQSAYLRNGRHCIKAAAWPGATSLSREARRFDFVLLALSRCRNPGVRRIIFPVAVSLNRLATDFFVFCIESVGYRGVARSFLRCAQPGVKRTHTREYAPEWKDLAAHRGRERRVTASVLKTAG